MGNWLRGLPTVERFWAQVRKGGPDECWMWTGHIANADGRGCFQDKNVRYTPSRFSYIMAKGPVGPGLECCHTCDVPRCVNPAHLFLGTHKENMEDMARKGRHVGRRGKRKLHPVTHCKHGHAYDEANTRVEKHGARACRMCDRIRSRLRVPYYQRMKAA